jgi:hypothetical protein
MFIAEEEHDSHRIVKLIPVRKLAGVHRYKISVALHLLEVWDLVQVAKVDDGEVLDSISNTVEDLILAHAIWVPVATESNDHQAILFT